MKASKTLIITGVFALLAVAAICYYALMQFAEEKYSIVLKDSSLEIIDFAIEDKEETTNDCLLYTSPSPRDLQGSRMPSSA